MNKDAQAKADRILNYTEIDRILPEDPYFRTRLEARTEDYFFGSKTYSKFLPLHLKLQPFIAIAAIVCGLFIGIFSGSRLSMVKSGVPVSERNLRLEKYANEIFFTEIKSSVEEQLLSK